MVNAPHDREAAAWLKDAKSETASLPIEKMPQLNASLERFAEGVDAALGKICGFGVNAVTERISTGATFDLLQAFRSHPAVVMRSAALDSRALMILDENIVDIVLTSLFRREIEVDPTTKASRPPPRPRTDLEARLVGGFAKALIACLRDAFSPVASFDLSFESLSTIVDVNLLGPREMAAITAQYTIKMNASAFRVVIVLPQTAAAPLAEMFSRGPDPDAVKIDPNWSRRMEQGVTQAKLNLTAVLDEFQVTLFDVASLVVGSVLPLSNSGEGHVRIECVERGVFLCRLGERNDRYALEIEDIIATNPDDEYFVAK